MPIQERNKTIAAIGSIPVDNETVVYGGATFKVTAHGIFFTDIVCVVYFGSYKKGDKLRLRNITPVVYYPG